MLDAWLVVDRFDRKTTYTARFLLNAYKQNHNANYGGTAPLGLYKHQDSSGAVSCH